MDETISVRTRKPKLLPKISIEFTSNAIGAYTHIYNEDGALTNDIKECVITIRPDKVMTARCIHVNDTPFSTKDYVADYQIERISVRES